VKVLLINPWEGEVFPPPAIGYLQAVLKAAGVDVWARDLSEAVKLSGMDWDLVAVTYHSFSVKYARQIRKVFAGHRLICGGHHPSAMPRQMLAEGYEQVVVGEGENAIIDIINGNTNSIVRGAPVECLDDLPMPDYSGLAFSGAMGVPIISSRGCPFKCSFCASAAFWGHKYRVRSVDNVLAEVAALGGREFMFEDDNFTASRRRAIDICSGLRAMGGQRWQCASRAEALVDEELCWNLRSAGCHTVWLGVESLSQRTLDAAHKNTTVEKMLRGITVAERAGINTMSQFIIGLPRDTQEDIDTTVAAIKGSAIRRRGANILWVLPCTDVYERAKTKGFNDDTYLTEGAPFYTYERNMFTLNYWKHLIETA